MYVTLLDSIDYIYPLTRSTRQAVHLPILIATRSFLGLGVLSSSVDQESCGKTAGSYRQLRNFKIDITLTRAEQGVAGVHWQAAQVSNLSSTLIAVSGYARNSAYSSKPDNSPGHQLAER
jgi:hypothetical protein